MAEPDIILGELKDPQDIQKLREYLIDLYQFADIKPNFSSVKTADATVTTLDTLTLDDGRSYLIRVEVVARRTGGSSGTAGDSAGYVIYGVFRRTAGGGATLVGSLTADHTAESVGSWNATLTTSGDDVLIRITGQADVNITWSARAFLHEV